MSAEVDALTALNAQLRSRMSLLEGVLASRSAAAAQARGGLPLKAPSPPAPPPGHPAVEQGAESDSGASAVVTGGAPLAAASGSATPSCAGSEQGGSATPEPWPQSHTLPGKFNDPELSAVANAMQTADDYIAYVHRWLSELRRAVDAYAVSGTVAALQRVLDVYGDMVVVWQHTYLRRPDFAAESIRRMTCNRPEDTSRYDELAACLEVAPACAPRMLRALCAYQGAMRETAATRRQAVAALSRLAAQPAAGGTQGNSQDAADCMLQVTQSGSLMHKAGQDEMLAIMQLSAAGVQGLGFFNAARVNAFFAPGLPHFGLVMAALLRRHRSALSSADALRCDALLTALMPMMVQAAAVPDAPAAPAALLASAATAAAQAAAPVGSAV